MIHNPFLLIPILICLEVMVLLLAGNTKTKHLFKYIPSMFWIYFLPMLLSTFGVIDPKNPLYSELTKIFLPPALFLLLMNIDIKSISRLGPVALLMFFAGSVGIIFGMVIVFILFKSLVGSQFWSGFGALAASWTGGSANMIAVKEALDVPDNVFMPMVIVDTVVPYTWLGILVALAVHQRKVDAFNNADRRILDDLAKRTEGYAKAQDQSIRVEKALMVIVCAFFIAWLARTISVHLPTMNNILSPYAWAIVLVTSIAILTSLTPLSKIKNTGSNKIGKWVLYFVLTTIGARASLNNAPQAGILILAGALVILFHAMILFITARLIRAPMFLMVTASMSNVAGLVSAPVVAEIYQPGLASVGLLLAILGHGLGAYEGILAAQICHMFVH